MAGGRGRGRQTNHLCQLRSKQPLGNAKLYLRGRVMASGKAEDVEKKLRSVQSVPLLCSHRVWGQRHKWKLLKWESIEYFKRRDTICYRQLDTSSLNSFICIITRDLGVQIEG